MPGYLKIENLEADWRLDRRQLFYLVWGANIVPDDGKIDLCIIKVRLAGAYFQLIWQALQNRHDREHRHIEYLPAGKAITLRTGHDVPIRADGEIIGKSSVSIEVAPSSLRIIAPQRET